MWKSGVKGVKGVKGVRVRGVRDTVLLLGISGRPICPFWERRLLFGSDARGGFSVGEPAG
jgi:hypothetical protein